LAFIREVDVEKGALRQRFFQKMLNDLADIAFGDAQRGDFMVGKRKGNPGYILQNALDDSTYGAAVEDGSAGVRAAVDPRDDEVGSSL
jgi:hypothetical protein